jgi:hypothetical protein
MPAPVLALHRLDRIAIETGQEKGPLETAGLFAGSMEAGAIPTPLVTSA